MRLIGAIFAGWFAVGAALAESVQPPAAEVTVMPAFEVASLSSDFEGWGKVRSPHFVIYTDGGMKAALATLRQLEACRRAEEKFFAREQLRTDPFILVLPTARSVWKKLESKAKVEWRVAVSSSGESVASLTVVQHDWQDEGLGVLQSSLATSALPRLGLAGPLWFNRGAGDFFETAELNGGEIVLGRPNERRVKGLKNRAWLPWERFFAINVESPEYVRAGEIERYGAQCAVFMHFLLTQRDPVWRERLARWRAHFIGGYVPNEADFQAIFGQGWKEWQGTMERHAAKQDFTPITYQLTEEELGERATESLDLRTREMRDLFVLVQILNQAVPASEEALDYMLAHGLKTASLRGVLVTACLEKRRPAPALGQLREMIAAKTENPEAWLQAARLRFAETVPELSLEAKLGAAALEIRDWSRRACELEPRLNEARELFGWSEALGPQCTEQNATAILQAFQQIDAHGRKDRIALALAIALWRTGDAATARTLAAALQGAAAVRPEIRALAGELVARLPEGK